MQKLKNDYQSLRAPDELQARLINDYERVGRPALSWTIPASAFAILFIGISAIWLYQSSVAPAPDAAPPAIRLSPAAAGLPGLTAQAGRFSGLSLSELRTPAGEFSSLPTLPDVPIRPSS